MTPSAYRGESRESDLHLFKVSLRLSRLFVTKKKYERKDDSGGGSGQRRGRGIGLDGKEGSALDMRIILV